MNKKNIVNLTVHKNTLDKRKTKEARKKIFRTCKSIGKIEGFVLIAWDGNGDARVNWDSGKKDPSGLPEFAKDALNRHIYE